MKRIKSETRNAIITLLVIILSGMFGNVIRENKQYVDYQELIIALLLILNFICGCFYWKSIKVRWLTVLWVLINGFSIFVFVLCCVGYHYWGWMNALKRPHIVPTLSPNTFIVLLLLNRLANMRPETNTSKKL